MLRKLLERTHHFRLCQILQIATTARLNHVLLRSKQNPTDCSRGVCRENCQRRLNAPRCSCCRAWSLRPLLVVVAYSSTTGHRYQSQAQFNLTSESLLHCLKARRATTFLQGAYLTLSSGFHMTFQNLFWVFPWPTISSFHDFPKLFNCVDNTSLDCHINFIQMN